MQDKHKLNRPSEVIYQVYPASFNDSDGDGHGDLKGITQKLDYIKSLGVDAIWISPFFLSPPGPEGDGGYAITDYKKIDPRYGTMEDFEQLLEEAHKRGLRIYTDFVLCHTAFYPKDKSYTHEWFEKSRRQEPGYEDYYVWHEGVMKDGRKQPPNNWKSCFTNGPAWTLDDVRGQYYLHHFNTSQPALNLNNTKVQDAILGEMKFWLDKGVDGLRLDALPFANHDKDFRDNPWREGIKWPNDLSKEKWYMQRFDHSMCQDQTIDLAARIRKLMDGYPTKKTTLGEVIAGREGGSRSPEIASQYIDPDKGLDTCYTESLIRFWKYPSAGELRHMLRENVQYAPDGGFCTNASNHDFPRAASRMTEGVPEELRRNIVKQLMSMYMSLPGSICMYQGEELGLPQATVLKDIPEHERHFRRPDIPKEKEKDKVDLERCRDGSRTPMPWDSEKVNAGFTTSQDPYLPVPGSHYARAVNLQESQPNSMLHFTRQLIQERKENIALSRGVTKVLDTDKDDPDIFAFTRTAGDQTVLLAYNMSGHAKSFKPGKYLDEETLNKLNIPAWSDVRIHAYSYARFGVRTPVQEKKDAALTEDQESQPPVQGKGKKIFALDMLIADHLVPDETAPDLIREHQLIPNRKEMTKDPEVHKRFLEASGNPALTLGGSTALTLWTLKKLLKDEVDISFYGPVTDDQFGRIAKDTLKKADIRLLTEQWPDGVRQQSAVSHVVRHPSGETTLMTYPGTEVDALNKILARDPELLKRSIQSSDIVYLPGGLTEKFGLPITQDILDWRWRYKKELVMSLPTHARFGPNDKEMYQRLVASANVVVGNDVEFCRLYLNDREIDRPVSDDRLEYVTKKIREAFRANVLENEGRPCPQGQVALITRGDKPAYLVIADKQGDRVLKIPAAQITHKRNVLGAGDAVAAGFLAGYIKEIGHENAAKLSMALAAEKIEQDSPGPYLEDPEKSLNKALLRSSLSDVAAAYRATGNIMPVAVGGRR